MRGFYGLTTSLFTGLAREMCSIKVQGAAIDNKQPVVEEKSDLEEYFPQV